MSCWLLAFVPDFSRSLCSSSGFSFVSTIMSMIPRAWNSSARWTRLRSSAKPPRMAPIMPESASRSLTARLFDGRAFAGMVDQKGANPAWGGEKALKLRSSNQ